MLTHLTGVQAFLNLVPSYGLRIVGKWYLRFKQYVKNVYFVEFPARRDFLIWKWWPLVDCRPTFYCQLEEFHGVVSAFYLDWLALSLGVWLILQLVRLWRLPRGWLTHSSYLFLLQARWQGVLGLAARGCGWLTTGSWIQVLISGKQKLRPSLPNCQFAACHGVSLALAHSVLSASVTCHQRSLTGTVLRPPWRTHI